MLFQAHSYELMALWESERQKREARSHKPTMPMKSKQAKEKAAPSIRNGSSATIEEWRNRYWALVQSL
jgi:hypothetical protein